MTSFFPDEENDRNNNRIDETQFLSEFEFHCGYFSTEEIWFRNYKLLVGTDNKVYNKFSEIINLVKTNKNELGTKFDSNKQGSKRIAPITLLKRFSHFFNTPNSGGNCQLLSTLGQLRVKRKHRIVIHDISDN